MFRIPLKSNLLIPRMKSQQSVLMERPFPISGVVHRFHPVNPPQKRGRRQALPG